MNLLSAITLFFLVSKLNANLIPKESPTAYGYFEKFGIPEAKRIQKLEDELNRDVSKITGGLSAALGQNPWQAGLLIEMSGINGTAVCGASLVTGDRLITAAHCWYDGQHQARRYTVVLGSVLLFSGGTRLQTSSVVPHPKWFPLLVRNDIAVVYLTDAVEFSDVITPVALPSPEYLNKDFVGESVEASGYGVVNLDSSITADQSLRRVNLKVISNRRCSFAFPGIVQPTNICTSGVGGVGPCGGDSGGPIVLVEDGDNVQIGIVSFGSAFGCSIGFPAVFTRVTSYMDFINQHL